MLKLNFSFLIISLIHILMLILGIKAKVSGGTLLAGIGLLIFEFLAMILIESEKLVLACIPLIVFCFGELVEFLSTKKEDNRKFGGNLTLNLITKILITLQAVILTLEHDSLLQINHKLILFIPFWMFFGISVLAGVAISFLFISKTISLCCHREDFHICELFLSISNL